MTNAKHTPSFNSNSQTGSSGIWWNQDNRGPLKNIPFLVQFGSMKFSKVKNDETMRPHLNDGIEIHFVVSGKYNWIVDDQEIKLLPGTLSITAPWQLNGSPSGKMEIGEIIWIVIKPKEYDYNKPLDLGSWTKLNKEFQKKLGDLIANKNSLVLGKGKVFKKYFVGLENELLNYDEGVEIMVGNIIENLFIDLYRHLLDNEEANNIQDHFIDKLNQIVLNDLNKKWIIDDLAYLFGMGKTKFTYEVKKLTGYPPNSYIINLKIEKAIEMINAGEKSISEIAYASGFSSLQHFTSTFSQRIGISPGKFKQNKN